MSDPVKDEKRSHKRVLIPCLAVIAVDEEHDTAYVEDISISGVQLRNADNEGFNEHFEIGNLVDLEIEDLSSLSGSVVRITEPMLAVQFPERSEEENKKLVAEIMARQESLGLADPEADDIGGSLIR